MCGIFGIVIHNRDVIPEKDRLEQTAHLLEHRGPDSFGVYSEPGIGLVHTRLSLVDLSSRSDQPFWDTEERFCIVYNGEIYNFNELRSELEMQGVPFRTTSDTEVLLQSIIYTGLEKTLHNLEGMFAFALYDRLAKTVVLARDRIGIKPLFIYEDDSYFVFASEVKALKPWITLRPDFPTVSAFLYGFNGPTKGYTFFDNVKILSPGSIARMRIGRRCEFNTFFSMPDFWDPEQADRIKHLKPAQIVDHVEELLLESVRKQLVADVPIGGLCSGGLDSSVIVAMAARFHTNLAIFHANVVGKLSEYDAALRLAKHLKLDLQAANVHDYHFIDEIPIVTEHFSLPFYICPHSVPLLMVFRLIHKNKIKAILSGEGSDECFLGYDYLSPDIRKWREYAQRAARKIFKTIVRRNSNSAAYWLNPTQFAMGLHTRFEREYENSDIRSSLKNELRTSAGESAYHSMDLLSYHLRRLLHRNDAMGMAASVEARFPFLDSTLVKFAVNMPYQYKVRFSPFFLDPNHYFFRDKWVVREIARRYLPRALREREKKPFPIDAFERMKISPKLFEGSIVLDMFGLTSREVKFLFENASKDLRLRLMHLEVWAKIFLANVPKEAVTERLRECISVPQNVESASVGEEPKAARI